MNESWIKLFRKFREWGWYSDSKTKDLFLELLLTANFEDKEWNGITIKRGQTIVGRKQLAETLGFTEQNIRTSMTKLKSTNEITSKIYSKFSVITINNYDKYQQLTSNSTSNQPATNQQLTTPKEIKNKRIKEIVSNKKQKTYTKDNLTLQQVAEKILVAFNQIMGTNHKNIKVFINNLEKCLEVHEPREIVEALEQIKYDKFWREVATPEKIFRQSKDGQPKDYIEDLLNSKKENYVRR